MPAMLHSDPLRQPQVVLERSEERFKLLVESMRDYAIFMTDVEGRIVSWNAGAEALHGHKPDEIIGQHVSRLYPAEAAGHGFPQHELEVARDSGRFEDEGERLRRDGSAFFAHVIITALRDEKGVLRGFGQIIRDLTERRKYEETLRQSEERFRLLVEGVKDYAIFMVDPKGIIVSWNSGAELICGYTAEEIIGQHISRFFPPELVLSGAPQTELETAMNEGRCEDEGFRMRKDGSRYFAHVIVTALRDRDGRLRGYTHVTRDLTAQRRFESLQRVGQRMQHFLTVLAHELRNPLAPIRNAIGIMRRRGLDEASSAWCRGIVDRQVTHLARLIDDLSDVGRLVSGKVALDKKPVELMAVIARAVEAARPLVDVRKQVLATELPPQPIWVQGDTARLLQVVLNLLQNAAKFTPEGGHITLSIKPLDDEVMLTVRDDGSGISDELLPRVFDLFVQGDQGLDRTPGGLGIGLTLVREIVGLHGGSVDARSFGQGRGSEFVVRLPVLREQPQKAPPAPRKASSDPLAVTPLRVLVVDDNRDSAQTMQMLLEAAGHEVRSVYEGHSAIATAESWKPQAVLLDLGLPGMDGYEVAEWLRQMPATARAKIIAMTGYGQEEDRRRTTLAGFDAHLVKPVEMETLGRILKTTRPAA